MLAHFVCKEEMKYTCIKCQCVCIPGCEAVHFGAGVHMYENTGSHIPAHKNFDIIL
jgi:hypothetical protein